MPKRPLAVIWGIIFALFLVDRVTKLLVVSYVTKPIGIIPHFFSLVHITNTGLAFGLLSHISPYLMNTLLIFLGTVISGVLIHLLVTRNEHPLSQFSLSLILAGALGNIVDRIIWGKVIDFLDFSIQGHHWPAFNFADSFITVGLVLYILAPHAPETD